MKFGSNKRMHFSAKVLGVLYLGCIVATLYLSIITPNHNLSIYWMHDACISITRVKVWRDVGFLFLVPLILLFWGYPKSQKYNTSWVVYFQWFSALISTFIMMYYYVKYSNAGDTFGFINISCAIVYYLFKFLSYILICLMVKPSSKKIKAD